MINAAALRAQVSQLEKIKTAVNTFENKYGALPGDISEPDASGYGFAPRGIYPGEGDGNGKIEGIYCDGCGGAWPYIGAGETLMFWSDLTYANGKNLALIAGNFNIGTTNSPPVSAWKAEQLPNLFPQAAIGSDNYIIASGLGKGNYYRLPADNNYFIMRLIGDQGSLPRGVPGFTSAQAYDIDSKIDDGFPGTGIVRNGYFDDILVGQVEGIIGNPCCDALSPRTPSPTTCYDNGGVNGVWPTYTLNQGNNMNCALMIQFN